MIGRDTDQQLLAADGLSWLDSEAGRLTSNKKFVDLREEQQLSILEPLCEAADANSSIARNVRFLALIKRLTADGYYTSKIGLIDELGYKGNTATVCASMALIFFCTSRTSISTRPKTICGGWPKTSAPRDYSVGSVVSPV